MTNSLKILIDELAGYILNPKEGLPDDVFYFIGRHTPYINVDLLIKIPGRGALLTWREDEHAGLGWHIPGGIIRFKESWEERINEVGKSELGIKITSAAGPIVINQIITESKERSHFISLLFDCKINDESLKIIEESIQKSPYKINFFDFVPQDFLAIQKIYSDYIS